MQARHAGAEHAPVRHDGGAEDDAAGLFDAFDDRTASDRDDRIHAGVPGGHRDPGSGEVLLHGDGYAVNGSGGLAPVPTLLTGARGREGALEVDLPEGVELGLSSLDDGGHVVEHVHGRQVSGGIRGDELGGAEAGWSARRVRHGRPSAWDGLRPPDSPDEP